MPNGGSDNCGECRFYSKNINNESQGDKSRLPYCLLRRVIFFQHPFYIYCDNFFDLVLSETAETRGPVYIDAGTYPHTRKIWIDEKEQTQLMKEQEHIAKFCKQTFNLVEFKLGDEFSYTSLALCVVDAVFSIGVKYGAVKNTIRRLVDKFGGTDRLTVNDLLKAYEHYGVDGMANDILENRQRTSTKNGILKADALQRFCQVLANFGVNQFDDVDKVIANTEFEKAIKNIPGQRSGISLVYFYILAGAKDYIKPDRMIQRRLSAILNRKVKERECQGLIFGASLILEKEYPKIRACYLDHLIWKHESGSK